MIGALAYCNTEDKDHKERVGLCHIHIYKTLTNWHIDDKDEGNASHTPDRQIGRIIQNKAKDHV